MKLSNKTTIIVMVFATIAFFTGLVIGSNYEKHKKDKPTANEIWTCSMHPEVQLPKAGKCPKCGMDLILQTGNTRNNDATYEMSPLAEKLAEIEVNEVIEKILHHKIPLVGKVQYDERTTTTISAWFPGRIDRLFVDFTGISVKKGEHLAEIYSPELLSAQEELIEMSKAMNAKNQSEFLTERNKNLFSSTKEKLRLWGLSDQQINEIIQRQTAKDRLDILANQNGVVINKMVNDGDYVKTGQKLFTIGSLEHLWAFLDVYESELPFIYFGQKVSLQAEAYPGVDLEGTVSFVQPDLSEKTRTVRVRVNVDNKDFKLKPGMLINAMVQVEVGKNGMVSHPDFTGKFICPMHPEIISDQTGTCDFCGMNLVASESLNIKKPILLKPAIVIPSSAALVTGKRAVVYIKKNGLYEGREIVLGPKVGHHYIVISGIEKGDLVVTKGNFKIDSSLQILAKPSMMQNEWKKDGSQFLPKFKTELDKINVNKNLKVLFTIYFSINSLLTKDTYQGTPELIIQLEKEIDHIISSKTANEKELEILNKIKTDFTNHKEHIDNIETLRKQLKLLSIQIIELYKTSNNPLNSEIFEMYCPMAKAGWVQASKNIENPYYGSQMLDCGEIKSSKKATDLGELK